LKQPAEVICRRSHRISGRNWTLHLMLCFLGHRESLPGVRPQCIQPYLRSKVAWGGVTDTLNLFAVYCGMVSGFLWSYCSCCHENFSTGKLRPAVEHADYVARMCDASTALTSGGHALSMWASSWCGCCLPWHCLLITCTNNILPLSPHPTCLHELHQQYSSGRSGKIKQSPQNGLRCEVVDGKRVDRRWEHQQHLMLRKN